MRILVTGSAGHLGEALVRALGEGGEEGGYLIAAGTPEEVAGEPESATGAFLAGLVAAKPR